MKIKKYFLSNLLVGAVLGLILSPFIWLGLNMLASKLNIGNVDFYMVILIVVLLAMVSMTYILRNREGKNENKEFKR